VETAALVVRPDRFVAGGDAMARDDDGRVVFVGGALPGETVSVEVTEARKDFARARVLAVVETSPDRVEPPCPQRRAGCGGCDWQHLAVGAQLGAKVAVIADALRRTARLPDAVVVAGASVPAEGYRTTVRVVGTDEGVAGFRQESSHDTVGSAGCLVAHDRLVELLDGIRVSPGLEVTLRCSTSSDERLAIWDPRAGAVTGLPDDVATGADAVMHQRIGSVDLRVSAMSFFQSGAHAAELLVDAVKRSAPELGGARRVVDLYGGVGLFAATVVPDGVAVTVVESSRPALADARVNVPHAHVVDSEVARWRPQGSRRRAGSGASFADVVIADPPRTGLGAPGAATVAAIGADTVVLVSCDPAAAARDTTLLVRAGYRHVTTEVLDLFPHTHHVEAVTRFTRAAPGEVR
jgi:23S rRNA (uracil1939-C5)-methyltransferase